MQTILNLQERTASIQRIFDEKKLTFTLPANKPPDISFLSIGDAKGRINAIVTPLGLPIISGLHQNSLYLKNFLAQFVKLKATVKDKYYTKENWSPWRDNACFADGMQPVVYYECNGKKKTISVWDMLPVDRYWIDETNVLRTICQCGEIELTVDIFADVESGLLVQNFNLKNTISEKLKAGMYYYAPVNPAGKGLEWSHEYKDCEDYFYSYLAGNSCYYHDDTGYLTFTSNKQEFWVLGGDRNPQSVYCGDKPAAFEWIFDENRNNAPLKSVENDVIDTALRYDLGEIYPGESCGMSMYLGFFENTDANAAAMELHKLISGANGDERLKRSVQFWNDWYSTGNVPVTGNKDIDSYIKKISILLKSISWKNGGISANPGELAQTYLRDSIWAYYGLAMAGFLDDAKKGILCLEGYTYLYGLQNNVMNDEKANAVIAKGFDENTEFAIDTPLYSMDDPAILIYTIGKIFEKDPDDLHFFRQVWPFIKYSVKIGERDIGKLGTVAQNEGFQDDMIHWRFRRSNSYEKGLPGLECVPWNMFWVTGIAFAAKIGYALGHNQDAEHCENLSNKIRGNIEKHFWNDERNTYAYFYDPGANEKYGGDRTYEDYTTENHSGGGHFVFPNHPLMCALTASFWSDYTDKSNSRAMECLKAVKEAYHLKLPETALGIEDAVFPSMGTEIVRLTHSLVFAGDPDAEKYFMWIVKNTPLAGIPENFPSNGRAVRCWENGELIGLFRDWYDIQIKTKNGMED